MNIIGHITIGIAGSLILDDYLFLVGSLLPDISLIPNELRFKKFNKQDILFKELYIITHSLFFPLVLFFINPIISLSVLLHILIDIPFHSSQLRWRPFLLSRYKTKKRALLLSGGMDSIACALIEKDFDCIYFNYGQVYHSKEFPFAKLMADRLGKQLIILEKDWGTDIENRNFYMIAELKKLGYNEVITGSRNLFPVIDKYGDSNWFNLKIYQYLIGIYINMPLVGCLKRQIKNKLNGYSDYFSTENYFKK